MTPRRAVRRAARRDASAFTPGISNRLLAALPEEDYRRLAPHLRRVPLLHKRVIYKHGDLVRDVCFPSGGMCSLTIGMQDGTMVEVGVVGREGFVGLGPAVGGILSTGSALVQIEGPDAQHLPIEIFHRELARGGALADLAARFNQALLALLVQTAACNLLHEAQARLPRWLLAVRDRIGSDEFRLTQDFLAVMLGVSRPTVTIVASTLQRAGLIHYHHGHVAVVDAAGLEESACECYGAVRDHYDRLLPGFLVQREVASTLLG